jgi:hypothetical protein
MHPPLCYPSVDIEKNLHKKINLDYYQHPDKRSRPTILYSRAHDIYSLGCVLLEIGLWKSLDELVDTTAGDYEITKQLFLGLTRQLAG